MVVDIEVYFHELLSPISDYCRTDSAYWLRPGPRAWLREVLPRAFAAPPGSYHDILWMPQSLQDLSVDPPGLEPSVALQGHQSDGADWNESDTEAPPPAPVAKAATAEVPSSSKGSEEVKPSKKAI